MLGKHLVIKRRESEQSFVDTKVHLLIEGRVNSDRQSKSKQNIHNKMNIAAVDY